MSIRYTSHWTKIQMSTIPTVSLMRNKICYSTYLYIALYIKPTTQPTYAMSIYGCPGIA